jgi:hypothetical protein
MVHGGRELQINEIPNAKDAVQWVVAFKETINDGLP